MLVYNNILVYMLLFIIILSGVVNFQTVFKFVFFSQIMATNLRQRKVNKLNFNWFVFKKMTTYILKAKLKQPATVLANNPVVFNKMWLEMLWFKFVLGLQIFKN